MARERPASLSSGNWPRSGVPIGPSRLDTRNGTDRCPARSAIRARLGTDPFAMPFVPVGAILLLVVGAKDTIHG
jgi:hypothetical protein